MTPRLDEMRPELAEFCVQNHIVRLSVFGSAARGDMRPDSDIDLLVEFEPGQAPSLAGFERLKNNLATLFGSATIDLATPSILRNPYRRRAIFADLKELYAA
jgi:predicted nucleotidyltransferase